ncbi:ABC transporter ATP-binding protein [Actinophytocola xanthii]|uniref:ABC transporter ATP-binding protein n=1 Tax=Actinophytocola xanthii TaxID=1912961 RepID=A0A1Q8CT41_9PSEU|nr:ABC transporter ATP-binding protein [Actinophytocola xanthii]OLF17531.1 ABC transporter ATP-binding protein [Actinophytocola xanthii]
MSVPAVDHAVACRGLGVVVGEEWLFRGLDLSLSGGECLVLAGPNGSGKSTLLHCLYGLHPPTEGTATVAGRSPDERDVRFRRDVAVLLDDSDLFAELSPRQHLELLATSFGGRAGDQAGEIDDALEAAGLADRADVHAYHLSAGQRRRLLLLGAVARPHRVLLLDEPERALDDQGRGWLATLVGLERDRGRAVVLATHHPPLLDTADTVVRLG